MDGRRVFLYRTRYKRALAGAGFLKNKYVLSAAHMHHPDGYIVMYKHAIGTNASIELSRIDLAGNVLWNTFTSLKDITDCYLTEDYIILFGTMENADHVQEDLFLSINLENGELIIYNYRNDKVE